MANSMANGAGRDCARIPLMPTPADAACPALECRGLRRAYQLGPERLEILKGVDLTVRAGESIAIMGASGSGKSTLLHLLGLLDVADAGEICIAGRTLEGLSEAARATLRNRMLGFVFQFHHLLPEFSALENVSMPLWLRGLGGRQARVRAAAVLEQVGLAERAAHRPAELSGGERQRVAIARALAGEPALLLMDEPTGNLDKANAWRILELIERLNRQGGAALVLVTHDAEIAARMGRRLGLRDGRLHPL
ncbi:MAG: ABC transporter ATP-binding protein [Cellvibrionales bacterium]|nr:ABC transporter ATP-binding protein [Cellvibrionales bacterium]